nr:BAG family molecular chaperone regulator 1 isoform X2 [Oryza sativa Japonica Group]
MAKRATENLITVKHHQPGKESTELPPLPCQCIDHRFTRGFNNVGKCELKKLLAARTGLPAADQRLTYRGKERGNADYLDVCGVKNRSKLYLAEDPTSVERRYIERQKSAKIETANRAIGAIALEVDKLADQVRSIEKSITRGSKVAEVQITTLIELLMRLAVKLDSIHAEGDSSSQKNIQAKRVQKCVETLDVLKISNARLQNVIVTTKWETFDAPATTQWELFD